MRQVYARRNYVMLHDNGAIHYPFTKFLTDKYDNPNSREAASHGLRVLYRFLNAHKIELAQRALEGRTLTSDEIKKLSSLAYRPLQEVDLLGDRKIILITSAQAKTAPRELQDAVEPNTARKRLNVIAKYLKTYWEDFISPHIHQASLKENLRQEYERAQTQLLSEIAGTKQNHHLTYQSFPADKFLALINKVVVHPEQVFQTASGKPSNTLWRDRAMVLLACEGLRPGAINNIARADFLDTGHLAVVDNRKRRPGRQTTNTSFLKMGDTVRMNSASETILLLYPFTYEAVKNYIEHERTAILRKHVKNRSSGFLFLTDTGEPIRDRSTLTKMFSKTGDRLREMGMLDVSNDPYFTQNRFYDFYGYVLRHSAADFYFRTKGVNDETIKSSKFRFGWTLSSEQWQRYANRILAEHSSVNLNQFYEQLRVDVAAVKK